MVNQSTFTATTTATKIGTPSHATQRGVRKTLHLENPSGGSTVYVGDSDVTASASNAITLAGGDKVSFTEEDAYQIWYALVASGTQAISYTETFDS